MALKDYYFTVSEAAKEARVTRQTISRWIADGKISVEKVGRQVLIKKDDFKEFIAHKKIRMDVVYLIEGFIKRIRKKFGYNEDDKVEFNKIYPKKNLFLFSVNRKNGTREKVFVKVRDVARTDIESDDAVFVGFKVQIENIERKEGKK